MEVSGHLELIDWAKKSKCLEGILAQAAAAALFRFKPSKLSENTLTALIPGLFFLASELLPLLRQQ